MTSTAYIRVQMCIGALLTLAIGTQAVAAAPIVVGPPVLGPVERPAKPLVLLFRAQWIHQENPFATGLVGGVMSSISETRYNNAAERTGQAIRTAVPNLDVASGIKASFRCGEVGSLCTQMVVLDDHDPNQSTDAALLSLLRSHEWSNARVLSFWWDQDDRRVVSHAALCEVRTEGDKVAWKKPVPVSYYITAPRAVQARAKTGNGPVPHSDEWEPGAPLPREAALRAAVSGLEPLLQMALSWGVNNDPISTQRIMGKPLFRKLRNEGVECNGLSQCTQGFDSVVDDRAWIWHYLAQAPEIKSTLVELQSRSRIDP